MARLVGLDWKFGVTASSSELQAVGSSFLQVRLSLDKGGPAPEEVVMEMTLPQFYEMMHQLEMAQAALAVQS